MINPDTNPNVILLVAAETINDCNNIPTIAKPLMIPGAWRLRVGKFPLSKIIKNC